MALYDNKHWLLSHIRNSFISTDDTVCIGMCEMVMASEDFPKQLAEKLTIGCYSPVEDSDEDDDIDRAESYDIQLDMDFGMHRTRSNTAQRLEKLDLAQKKAAKTKHVKWETPELLTFEQMLQLFAKRDYKKDQIKTQSLLTENLKKYTNLPQNPYLEFAKFDGNAQMGIPVRKYKIFLTMLPEEQRNYPMNVYVIATAKISDLIGLILLKCSTIHGDFPLKLVNNYGLYITEEDGEVDHDFPNLDPRECVAKFGFNCLGLVEHNHDRNISFESTELYPKKDQNNEKEIDKEARILQQDYENMARMKVHTTAMEAPLYQCYKVFIVHKVRAKTEIHLGISGEKIEIDPVQQKNSKFWVRQKAVSYHMDSVAWCELLEAKSNRASFRLVYSLSHTHLNQDLSNVAGTSQPMLQTSASFKSYDFETDVATAKEIVQKVNLILELRSSSSRKEYLASREKKTNRRKSFNLNSKS